MSGTMAGSRGREKRRNVARPGQYVDRTPRGRVNQNSRGQR